MKTSRLLPLLFVSALTVGMVASADSAPVTQSRDLSGFDRIEMKGSVDVTVHEGPSFSVKVVAPESLQKKIETSVKGHTLVIDNARHGSVFSWSFGSHERAEVRVTMPRFLGLTTRGSGDARIQVAHRNDVTLTTRGSGDVEFQGLANHLTADTHGSGDFTLEGAVSDLTARTTGSGNVHARNLKAQTVEARTRGSGDITVTVEGGPAELSSTGSGDIDWYGKSSKVTRSSRGSGDISHHG